MQYFACVSELHDVKAELLIDSRDLQTERRSCATFIGADHAYVTMHGAICNLYCILSYRSTHPVIW